jgi:hypothetical protein
MQRSKQREDYLRRLDRYTQEGVPETVWQKRCLEKAAASSEKTTPKVPAPTHFQGLRIFGPLSLVDSKFAGFLAEACRACSGRFVFQTTKATATILTGIPTEVKYKAISYVWGVVQPLGIYCKCGGRKDVPIADPERFCALLSLASTADDCDGVWLDALSIDQDSHLDKKSQIAAMGDIYEHAGSVLVLLPGADQKLFDNLCVLRESALQQDGMGLMDFNNITPDTFNASHEQIVETFCSSLEAHKQSLNNGSYFQRAWTFQEWALARDVDVTCESMSLDKSMAMLPELKTCVIRAAVRLAIHRRTSSHGGLRCKIRNADLAAFIDDVRALFPQEEIFSSISEVDWDELIVDNMIPFSGVDNQFRLRLIGRQNPSSTLFSLAVMFCRSGTFTRETVSSSIVFHAECLQSIQS